MRTYKNFQPLHLSKHEFGRIKVDVSAWTGRDHLIVGVTLTPDFRQAIAVAPELARDFANALLEAVDAIENQEQS